MKTLIKFQYAWLFVLVYLLSCSDEQKIYIQPPFPALEIPYTDYEVDASKPIEIKHGETKIQVPANAFIDKDGNVVEGKVKLQYRQYLNAQDILQSGIPMQTSPTSNEYLESAGMVQLDASINGQDVYANPDQKITVTIPSKNEDDNFQFYAFDPKAGTWNTLSEPIQTDTTMEDQEDIDPAEDLLKDGVANPPKPKIKDKKKYQFKTKVGLAEYEELKGFLGIQWEFCGKKKKEDPEQNKWVMKTYWSEFEIVKRKRNGAYKLRLANRDKEFITTCKPVYDESSMKYNNMIYSKKYKEYRKKLDARKKEIARIQKLNETIASVNRSFQVSEFKMIYNLDRVWVRNDQNVKVKFEYEDGETAEIEKCMLVAQDINSVINYTAYTLASKGLTFDQINTNSLIVINREGDTYAVKQDQFDEIDPNDKEATFILEEGETSVDEETLSNMIPENKSGLSNLD